jgi:hypothetical protein
LSNTSHEKLIIGSGTLAMGLDENEEKRLEHWEHIWSTYPLMNRLATSKTWENPKLYQTRTTKGHSEGKNEL